MKTCACAIFIAAVLASPLCPPAAARPVNPADRLPRTIEDTAPADDARAPLPRGLAATSSAYDTVVYGGTYWAADSMRWEAIRGGMWTFDTGVASAYGPTGPNKPAGYHTLMEGWYGVDETLNPVPYFRRSATCAIDGLWSYWAGVTAAEATALCYSSGQGYGNNWNLEIRKTFAYPGTGNPPGNATLGYRYHNETEDGWDFSYAVIDTSGNGSAADIVLMTYTGVMTGIESLVLTPGVTLPSSAHNVIIKFLVASDGAYSDQDGANPTTCGAFAVDDIQLTGSITDYSDFESGPDGWSQVIPITGVGDYSNIVDRNTALPAGLTFCACGVKDSVLVFFDELGHHPLNQDNTVASPWIDLARGGDVGHSIKLIMYDVYAEMPIANYVFTQIHADWRPRLCPVTDPFRPGETVYYYSEAPFCTGPGTPRILDYSGMIPSNAEEVQLQIGMMNLCEGDPFGTPCSGITNTTPWFDNIRLGVAGPVNAPYVTLSMFDYFQDAFARDGSLNPSSTGRIDTNTIKNMSSPGPGAVLRDTLVARGDGGNTEVRLVFRVRPGPRTNAAMLATWASRWTAEPALGPGWYSARMDTAEQAGNKAAVLTWMTCFHESDPGFAMIGGTDRTPDPADPSGASNKDFLPDNLFTPGSRIDYFVKARYIPPDPRNPGGTNWYVTPDTAGGKYLEMEVLPSSMAADTTWNCTLYVNHHASVEFGAKAIEEASLNAWLGMGGHTAEGTRFDRWDAVGMDAGQVSFGRALQTVFGVSTIQIHGYRTLVWHSGGRSTYQLTDEDANIINPWLSLRGCYNNRFWGSGDGLATSMNNSGEPATLSFMRNTLGVVRTCNTTRDLGCPTGTILDSTYCLPLHDAPGAHFSSSIPASARGNGCPDLRSFDLLAPYSVVPTAKTQANYVKNGVDVSAASVSNHHVLDVDYRTVLDGFAIGQVRTTPGNAHVPALCTDIGASLARTDAVLDWFGSPVTCAVTFCDGAVENGPKPPQFRTSLGNAYPNPAAGRAATRIQFTNGVEGGRVSLKVFDVTGRLVRTLLADQKTTAGPHEVTWDGRTDEGAPVTGGMYFYKLSAPGYDAARKIVVMR